MSYQSYRDVFVVNNPTLFKSGFTNEIGVNQLGIVSIKKNTDDKFVYPPNYQVDRTIQFIQGTPEVPTNLLAAIANQSRRSKPVKGKSIISWTGAKAKRGQKQIVALGFDGIDTDKTLKARCEETKYLYIKLSGGPVDEMFHTEGKGFVRQFSLFSGCCDDCGDDCSFVSADKMADDLVRQVNEDPIYAQGSPKTGNKLIKARKILSTGAVAANATCYRFLLTVCDGGNDTALGLVQGQYPGSSITRVDRTGANSTYEVIKDTNSIPSAYNNSGIATIADCPVCPSGYTLSTGGYAYKVTRVDAGDAGALTTIKSAYGIASSTETGNRVNYQLGTSTYIIVSDTAQTAQAQDGFLSLGQTRSTCVLTTPSNITWNGAGTLNRFNKTYRLTVHDNVCGVSRFAELQDAYPLLTITQIGTGETTCSHRFETTILSDCVPAGCPPDAPKWVAPQAFQGLAWEVVPTAAAGADVKVGVIFESSYVDREVTTRTYDYWSFEEEPIFIEISQHSHDYHDKPTVCDTEWPVTVLQEGILPTGQGAKVMEIEEFFKGYERKYRDLHNPIANDLHDANLQADPKKWYDQYTLEFNFSYHDHWFTERLTDRYRLEFYVPEGTGKELEAAVNGYLSSIGIDIDPVVL